MPNHKKNTGISFLLSLIIHLAILSLFVLSIGFYFQDQLEDESQDQASKKQIVQAVAVDQKQVQVQVARIKAAEQAKKASDLAYQHHLQSLASQAKSERQAELQRVAKLQQQQKLLESQSKQKQIQAQQQLARLNQLQAEAQQKLNHLETQQEQIEQQNHAIQSRLTATKQALQEQQSTAKKEELQQQLATEQAEQQALAKQQMLNQLARYKTLILNAIGKQWIIPQGINPNLSCQLLVRLTSDGTVQDVQLIRSSGNPVLDQSAITAVLKASPLPIPQNPLLLQQFRELQLTVKPEGLLD